MAHRHDIEDVIYRSRIRTAAQSVTKSTFYDEDLITNFISEVCDMADDYERKYSVPRSHGWSNQ